MNSQLPPMEISESMDFICLEGQVLANPSYPICSTIIWKFKKKRKFIFMNLWQAFIQICFNLNARKKALILSTWLR